MGGPELDLKEGFRYREIQMLADRLTEPGPGAGRALLILVCAVLLAACGGDGDPSDTASAPGSIPRERTLIMDCSESTTCGGQMVDYDSFNPFVPGALSRTGFNFLYEPLFFFNAYEEGAELIPWIATGHRFDESFTELEVDIRRGVEWSDGEPWTAEDFVFTIDMLKQHSPDLLYSTDMVLWVAEEEGKTDNAERQLEVPWELAELLLKQAEGKPSEGYLFAAKTKTGHRGRTWLREAVKRVCKEAKVPRVCPHGLRGTHATLAREAGATGHLVAKQLGHGSVRVTEEHYIEAAATEKARNKQVFKVMKGGKK